LTAKRSTRYFENIIDQHQATEINK